MSQGEELMRTLGGRQEYSAAAAAAARPLQSKVSCVSLMWYHDRPSKRAPTIHTSEFYT